MVRPLPGDDAAPRQSSLLRRCRALLFPPAASFTIASHIVPLLVCLSLIPLILSVSLFSGWYIWKNFPAAWHVPVYLQYGDGPSPYAALSLPPLSTTHHYDVSLQLVLPASEANFALGNFMATLSLFTPSNKSLITVSRPAIALPPKRAAFFSTTPRLIDVDVPLLTSYAPGSSKINARIDLGRRDGWKSLGNGEGRELSVWNAALRGAVKRRGIWGFISRFPITFALLASTAFFSLSVIALGACIFPAIRWPLSMDQSLSTSESKDRPVRTRKRARKSVTGESRVTGIVHKSEDSPTHVPLAHTSDGSHLKRRRSRMSDALLDSEN